MNQENIAAAAEQIVDEVSDQVVEGQEPEEQEGQEGQEAAPAEKTAEQIQEEIDGRFAALRRYEREVKSREKDFEAKLADLDKKLAKYEGISGSMRTKPEEAWEQLAREAGLDPDDYLERVVERRVSGGKPSEKEVWQELQMLREELAAKERKAQEEAEQVVAQAQQQQVERAVVRATADWCETLATEEGRNEFPSLAHLHPSAIEARVTSAMLWAVQNPKVPLKNIIKEVDKMVAEEYAPQVERLKKQLGIQDLEAPVEAPAELRTSGNKPATPRRKSISNEDQAVRSGSRKPMSRDERLAAAARYVPIR